MYRAIQTRSQTSLAKVKDHLKILHNKSDKDLTALLAAAKVAADAFIQRSYVDIDGKNIPIPEDIELWIKQRVASDYYTRESNVTLGGVTGAGTFELTEEDRYRLQIHKKIRL